MEYFLAVLVRIKLARIRPTIIGITGSIGKTSTKEAIATVLGTKFSVYRPQKSYNTEIGMLLGILEQESGFSSPLKWMKVIIGALLNSFFGKKYRFWILEYGADKPGDIQHLIRLVRPHIAVITKIEQVHQAPGQFKNTDAVFNEKKHLATCLSEDELAILNYEDEHLRTLDGKLRAKTLWFNHKEGIDADDLKNTLSGFSAKITLKNETTSAHFSILGAYHIDLFLPALLIGTHFGIKLKEGVHSLQKLHLPPGRMSRIEGINNSILLDSSYNSSPAALHAALELLKHLSAKRHIAVLGNMNELGTQSENAHREIGRKLASWLGLLITVGDDASHIADEALKHGMPKSNIITLSNAEKAGTFLKRNLRTEDVVLFKGSQNKVRLERAIKMVMKHPEQAEKLLCRQEEEWQKIV